MITDYFKSAFLDLFITCLDAFKVLDCFYSEFNKGVADINFRIPSVHCAYILLNFRRNFLMFDNRSSHYLKSIEGALHY